MPKVSLVIIMLLQAVTSFAQNYFVFIGSDNRQPFYVRVDSEFHGSSPEGHLILSQLKDSNYNITVGFPGQSLPEQHYVLRVDGKDQAFELRFRDPGGLRLYDLQNNLWLSPRGGSEAPGEARSAGVKKDDAFSRMMAGVVHDTAVLYNTYAMEQALSDSPVNATVQSAPVQPTASNAQSALSQSTKAQSATSQSTNAQSPSAQSTATITQPTVAASQATVAPAQPPITTQSGPPDTANATVAITTPPTTQASPDSSVNPRADSTIAAATSNSATSPAPATASPGTAMPSTTMPGSATSATGSSATSPAGAKSTLASSSGPTSLPSSSASRIQPPTSSVSATSSPASPAGAIAHQPAARFKDSAATTARITKLSERHTTKNVRLVYTLRSGTKKTDTIDVVIPVDSPATAKTAGHELHATDSNHFPAGRVHGPNTDTPAVSSSTASRLAVPPAALADATRSHPVDSSHKPGKTIVFMNSDCHDFATDFDVDKLRIKMLQSTKDEERIAVARKAFKVKCFYTRQIRALSDVFTSDATRFRFFEAAWPFAADEHFHELSDLLVDPAYNARFKTMTHQQ